MNTSKNLILFSLPVSQKEAVDFEKNSALVANSFSDDFQSADNYLKFLRKLIQSEDKKFVKKLSIITIDSKENSKIALVWNTQDELDFSEENQKTLKVFVEELIAEFEKSSAQLLQKLAESKEKGLDTKTKKEFIKLRSKLRKDPTKALEDYVELCEDLNVQYDPRLDLAEKINRDPGQLLEVVDRVEISLKPRFEVLKLTRSKAVIRLDGKRELECSIEPADFHDFFNLFLLLQSKETGKLELLSRDFFKQPNFNSNTLISYARNSIQVKLRENQVQDIWNFYQLLDMPLPRQHYIDM